MAGHPYESEYLYGIHDPGGEHIMLEKGIPGWVLFTEKLGADPNDQSSRNYRPWSDKGLGVMVRLNYGYEEDGTLPFEARYADFARRCGNFVRQSAGAAIWIIGNEPNHPIEWPGGKWDWSRAQPISEDRRGEPITPQRYARCFRLVRQAIKSQPGHENDLVLPAAVAPWNALTRYPGNENGDWVKYFVDMLNAIGAGNLDGITLHTYTRAPTALQAQSPELIWSEAREGAAGYQHLRAQFRAYQDFMNAIPAAMRRLPVYITETNPHPTWENRNTTWVQRAYGEIDYWNRNNRQKIRALILFRWTAADPQWGFEHKQGVIDDFRQALDYRYKWNVGPTWEEPIPVAPEYSAALSWKQPPGEAPAGSEITVVVIARNAGSREWPSGGSNPVRLGYRWYDAAGKPVAAVADLRTPLPRPVKPGETVELTAKVALPAAAGTYRLAVDLVHEGITWFADRGSAPLEATVRVAEAPAPTEYFFPETKIWVRGAFWEFFRRYGLDICGYPITDVFIENGMPVQYFQRVALEEYEKGKVRLRLTAAQALEAGKRIAALEQQVKLLNERLRQGGGAAPRPPIQDVIAQLPRDPAGMKPRPDEQTRYLIIHHTGIAGPISLQRVAQIYRQRGYPAILCQYYVDQDGTIYQTNPHNEAVSEARWAQEGINICVAGNFTDTVPNPAQMEALAALCAWLLDGYGLETAAIRGLSEGFSPTQSPGRQWLSDQRWKDQLVARVEELRGRGPVTDEKALAELRRQLEQMRGERDRLAALVEATGQERDRLREQVNALTQQMAALQAEIAALRAALQEAGKGAIPQPTVRDVITQLPRDPARMAKRTEADIAYIVIHHTAVPPSVGVQRVAQAHRARWPAILSQFFIDGEGAILQTNPILEVVDGQVEWIARGINIHVAGHFNEDIPSEAQLQALAHLVAWLQQTYSIPDENVRGAREFIVTQSPGEQWLSGRRWKALLMERVQAVRAAAPSGGTAADRAQIAALKAQLEATRGQLAQVQAQNAELNRQIEALRRQLETAPGDTQALRDQIVALQRDKQALEAERKTLQDTITGLNKTIADLRKEIEALRARPGPTTPVKVTKPDMVELVDKLPKHPTNRYPTRPLSAITHIAIHHSAAPANVPPERIAQYHVNNPEHQWPGIGYHFYIGPDGTIYHTQDLSLASYHVYQNNDYTVGVCVAGDFTEVIPTPAQIQATARLVAWLMQEFNIPLGNVWGHKEFPKNMTACPGKQWLEGQKWKQILFEQIQVERGERPATAVKPLEHYVLFWQRGDAWAKEDWQGAINYIARFRPTAGFSVDDAKQARRVTIVGGPGGVSPEIENELRAAGVQVERVAGKDYAETKALLDRLAATGRRFATLE